MFGLLAQNSIYNKQFIMPLLWYNGGSIHYHLVSSINIKSFNMHGNSLDYLVHRTILFFPEKHNCLVTHKCFKFRKKFTLGQKTRLVPPQAMIDLLRSR
jgi:hypothetical protein